MLHSSDLKGMPPEEVQKALSSLTPQELEELQYTWGFWARPNQLAPEGDWRVWLLNCGRGFGKTRTGAEWVREQVKLGYSRIAVVGPTKGSVRQVMVDGTSGLLSVCYDTDKTVNGIKVGKPVWSPTNNTVTWYNQDNGKKVAVAEVFSAEDPERLRGPQFERAWCFTRGTTVATPTGLKDVSEIEVGDLVTTSTGPHKVLGTSVAKEIVGEVVFSDGRKLTGTAEHPIMTQRGWVNLSELKVDDQVCAVDVLSTQEKSGVLSQMDTTLQAKSVCTEGSTETTSVAAKGLTYTTLMETNSTTVQITCKNSQGQSTSNFTMVKGVSQLQRNLKGIVSSLVNTVVKTFGRNKPHQKQSVKVANTRGQKKNEKLLGLANSAAQSLEVESETCVLSVVSTWQPMGQQNVYNIQVETTPEYFANGILTHNCDEICAWTRRDETWDMLRFCMRLGTNPKIVVTTTPKPDRVIRSLVEPDRLESGEVVLTLGSSYENEDNIDLTEIRAFEGTRLGRQEIHAEILTEAAGALWTKDMLEKCEAYDIDVPVEFARENLKRVVVSVDPATTSNKHSDDTGIVVAGVDINGIAYILEDATDKYTPEAWATKAIQLYDKYGADCLVAEKNQGGDLVRSTFKTVDETIPITLVHASKGKFARAEPVSALYEQGKVKHLRGLMELEDQMVTWEPLEAIGSPDRLDAMVWAIYTLLLKNRPKPKINILSNDAQSLSLF